MILRKAFPVLRNRLLEWNEMKTKIVCNGEATDFSELLEAVVSMNSRDTFVGLCKELV